MDYRRLIAQHCQNQADVTVATLPVQRKDVPAFGIMRMADDYRITAFVEKPKEKRIQDEFLLEKKWYPKLNIEGDEELFLASMGIYVFTPQALFEMLDNNWHDFGKDIIPASLKPYRICAYIFKGAWEDIGTIRAYFDCNLDLTSVQPRFNFYDMTAPVFTRARFLPASKINAGAIEHSLISEGCTVNRAAVSESLLGIRSMVGEGARLHRTIVMGADYFETESSVREHQTIGLPPMGIGRNTRIENAIVDKNARIGENCIISAEGKDKDLDHDLYCVRDGIVVIPKNGVVPNGTVI
jgi:glucose-1-phosphate adenylyltransferase